MPPPSTAPRPVPRILLCTPLVLLLAAGAAQAQDLGLDLGDEEPQDEQDAGGADDPGSDAPQAEDLSGDDQPELAEGDLERDVTLGDRVKAVQRKHFLKRGRLHLEPTFGFSLNDAFRPKLAFGAVLGYHLADSLALQIRYDRYVIAESDNQRLAKRELQAVLPFSNLEWSAGGELAWTPIYGKLAFLGGIVQYDLYLTTGLGAAWSQTSGEPVKDGPHPAAALGIGQRFAFADFVALHLGVRQLLYADRPGDREISEIQKVLTLQAGLSFWIPPSFEYAQ